MAATSYHHLPVEAYTSPDWYKREQEAIFSRVWRYAGFVEDLAEPGDYLTVQAGNNNLLVLLDMEGQRRAFHNVCRHRGTQLLRAVGNKKKAIACPYHDWTYGLDGRLISIPQQSAEFGEIDKSCLGLLPASVEAWRGMLFVHPDPQAAPLREWFGAVEPYLGPHVVEELVEWPEARSEYEIQANWKIVVENYIDVYHLSHLHAGTLGMYEHRKAEYGFVGPHFALWEPLTADYAEKIESQTPMPLILPPEQLGTWVPMLFPGIGLAESESSWSTFIVTPLGPERTKVESRTRVKNASSFAFTWQEWRSASYWAQKIKPKAEDGPEDDPLGSADFTTEDVYVCEQQQRSLQSPHFVVGPAAKGEAPILDHQRLVLDYLKAV